jgi:hypothetical protein
MKRKLFLTSDDVGSYIRTNNGLSGQILKHDEPGMSHLYRVEWDTDPHLRGGYSWYNQAGLPYNDPAAGWIEEVSTTPFVTPTAKVSIESLTELVLAREKIVKLHPNQNRLMVNYNASDYDLMRVTLENGATLSTKPNLSTKLPSDLSKTLADLWDRGIQDLNITTKKLIAEYVENCERQIKEHLK